MSDPAGAFSRAALAVARKDPASSIKFCADSWILPAFFNNAFHIHSYSPFPVLEDDLKLG